MVHQNEHDSGREVPQRGALGVHMIERANRYAGPIKWVSAVVIVAALLLIMGQLPMKQAIEHFEGTIESLGLVGMVIYGVIYVSATVLFIPGSILTAGAGFLFGLVGGTIVVSLGSTTGAALAFLIARYFARDQFAKKIEQYPKFSAIDKAIGQRGWKIVALLRLSPAVPFNFQNYLYGLTSIRFVPCVLVSWVAMMPGTFMYVFLGKIGKQGVQAASGVQQTAELGKAMLMGVGLLATVAVTIYITHIAKRAIKMHTNIEDNGGIEPVEPDAKSVDGPKQTWPWGSTITALLAIGLVAVAGLAQFNPIGPPTAVLSEKYEENIDSPIFDHGRFNVLLAKHVDLHGWIDYEGLNKDAEQLDAYITDLGQALFDKLGRNEKLAFLINAYNAFTLRLILDHWNGGKLTSIKSIGKSKRWDHKRWRVGNSVWSLNDIEHKQIRPKFSEPRIHFALVCAAVGCPKLRNEAYRADQVERQMEDQAKYVHEHDRWFRFDSTRRQVYLTRLYDWYGKDFEQVSGTVLGFAARYRPDLREALASDQTPKIKWLKYDWNLNDKANRAPVDK